MKLKSSLWGVSLCVVCVFLLGHVAGIHINRELQNLSIESEGDVKIDEPSGSNQGNNRNSSSISISNFTTSIETEIGGIDGNITVTNETSRHTSEYETDMNVTQGYNMFNGTFDFKNTRFEDGIAYDGKFEGFSAKPLNTRIYIAKLEHN